MDISIFAREAEFVPKPLKPTLKVANSSAGAGGSSQNSVTSEVITLSSEDGTKAKTLPRPARPGPLPWPRGEHQQQQEQ